MRKWRALQISLDAEEKISSMLYRCESMTYTQKRAAKRYCQAAAAFMEKASSKETDVDVATKLRWMARDAEQDGSRILLSPGPEEAQH